MEQNQFGQLLQLKGIRDKETVSLLQDFIGKFPYCQSSRILLAKALHEQNSIHYEEALKAAAAYVPDRGVLKDLIDASVAETEFEFPLFSGQPGTMEAALPEKNIPVQAEAATEPPPEPAYTEWYSEEEISGREFEERKEKEKISDPHEVIRQRLNEILASKESNAGSEIPEVRNDVSAPPPEPHVAKEPTHSFVAPTPAQEIFEKPVEEFRQQVIEPVRPSPPADDEESVYVEDLLAEQKLEEEIIHPEPEKSVEEKMILREAEKAQDVLDKLELEHAMEESILASLEKLPILSPEHPDEQEEKKERIHPVDRVDERFESDEPETSSATDDSSKSFTDWLKATRVSSFGKFEEVHARTSTRVIRPSVEQQDEPQPPGEPESDLSDDELIDKFIKEEPKIVPSRAEFYSPVNQAKKSVMDHDDVVSETLARIYLSQGNVQKARWCYEKLMLLHPEKSAFFAALLKEISSGGGVE